MAGPELLIISAGLQAFQGFQAYQQGKAQAKAATQAADYNARVEAQRAQVEKTQLQRQQRLFQGQQTVRAGATGATLGSFDDLFEDTESQSLLDQALLDYDTKVKQQQILYGGQQQAYTARSEGRNGLISGLTGAASTGFKAYQGFNAPSAPSGAYQSGQFTSGGVNYDPMYQTPAYKPRWRG